MGELRYGERGLELRCDDRTLTHLQLAIGAKLRRGESFFLGWRGGSWAATGALNLWIHPSIPLAFSYASGMSEDVNPAWLAVLVESADGQRGMQLLDEPARR